LPEHSLGFDPTVPSERRITDAWLGGKDNFAPDRTVAERAVEIAPELPVLLREARKLLRRILPFLADAGIRQIVDMDVGLPIEGHVEEIGLAMPPGTRVVYAERDPVAVVHTRTLAKDRENSAVLHADVTDPDQVFGNDELGRVIDLSKPVGVLMMNLLHTIPDDDVVNRMLAVVRAAIAPGSFIAIVHAVSDICPDVTAKLFALFLEDTIKESGGRDNLRTKAEVETLFDGLDLVEPGVVYVPAWRPAPREPPMPGPESVWSVVGVARKRGG
jgi:hypothetical protein